MKNNYYKFPKTTTSFSLMYDVDIIGSYPCINDIDTDFQFTYEPSNNIKRFLGEVDDYFYSDLFLFAKDYNTKFKKLKMKKKYHSINGLSGEPDAPIMVTIEMKRGKCYVSYSPLLQTDGYDENCMDTFNIKTNDMLKFLNNWSKKIYFKNK